MLGRFCVLGCLPRSRSLLSSTLLSVCTRLVHYANGRLEKSGTTHLIFTSWRRRRCVAFLRSLASSCRCRKTFGSAGRIRALEGHAFGSQFLACERCVGRRAATHGGTGSVMVTAAGCSRSCKKRPPLAPRTTSAFTAAAAIISIPCHGRRSKYHEQRIQNGILLRRRSALWWWGARV